MLCNDIRDNKAGCLLHSSQLYAASAPGEEIMTVMIEQKPYPLPSGNRQTLCIQPGPMATLRPLLVQAARHGAHCRSAAHCIASRRRLDIFSVPDHAPRPDTGPICVLPSPGVAMVCGALQWHVRGAGAQWCSVRPRRTRCCAAAASALNVLSGLLCGAAPLVMQQATCTDQTSALMHGCADMGLASRSIDGGRRALCKFAPNV